MKATRMTAVRHKADSSLDARLNPVRLSSGRSSPGPWRFRVPHRTHADARPDERRNAGPRCAACYSQARVVGRLPVMCGIAGYSLTPESTVDRTVMARALLAGIAERGADAAGFAYRDKDSSVTVHKQRTGASELLHRIDLPQAAAQLLVHVRDFTKGHPRVLANNHPIRHGAVVGIHNGTIVNDDELFAAHGIERAGPA